MDIVPWLSVRKRLIGSSILTSKRVKKCEGDHEVVEIANSNHR